MMAPVVVYPASLDAAPSEPEPHKLADHGVVTERGYRVRWHYTSAMPEPDCAYCSDGRCEQRVESCAMWSRDVVVHDRPRWVQ